jgi:hypothetical protein
MHAHLSCHTLLSLHGHGHASTQWLHADLCDLSKPQLASNSVSCTAALPSSKQAERRLQEEVERVRAYLDDSTEPKITKVAERELIAKQVRVVFC